jgi:hypothetical protein
MNESKPILINQINENEQDEIDPIRKYGYNGQNYNPNFQTNRNNNSGKSLYAYCQKPGHQVEKCFTKFPALKNSVKLKTKWQWTKRK